MKFNPKEIENPVITGAPGSPFFGVNFDYPITPRENVRLNFQHKGMWLPSSADCAWFNPLIIPDNPARAFVIEAEPYNGPVGGKDMFGIEWEYEPKSRGSIVRPGNSAVTDITKWRECVSMPDFDSYDWAGSLEKNREYLQNSTRYVNFVVFTGWYERMISFMDCGPALVALQRRQTQEAVADLLNTLSDIWIDLVDHVHATFGNLVDGFLFHDDWGAQDAPFFNPRIVDKLLVPAMKRVTDHCHELGYTTSLHSCGKIDKLVPSIIAAGWDSWDGMGINDYHTDYEQYGDKLIMNCTADETRADGTEEEQRAAAQSFVDEYANQDKPCALSFYVKAGFEFRKELYRLSRIKYCGEEE